MPSIVWNLYTIRYDKWNEFTDKNKQIEWYKIAGLRNRIAHDYPGLDFEFIWSIINNEIPSFEKALKTLIV